MKKCIAPVLIILLFTYSVMPAFSTETDISAKAVADARKDAAADINKTRWFFYGCCFGPTGYIVAINAGVEIPAQRLIGKSSEYVIRYSAEYRRKTKTLRNRSALIGCIGSTTIAGYVIVEALSSGEEIAGRLYFRLFGDTRLGGF
ncbi:MAG: hypothetical protein OXH00_18305 [Candidatus Poribacteria bacterium]|nr:hypothetical protein [Candidatus Poribacteria bacterium]